MRNKDEYLDDLTDTELNKQTQDRVYAMIMRLLHRQQQINSSLRSLSVVARHLDAAHSDPGRTETHLRAAAQRLAEFEENPDE